MGTGSLPDAGSILGQGGRGEALGAGRTGQSGLGVLRAPLGV